MLRRRGEDASGLQWQSFLPALATALSLVACAAVIVASSPDQVGGLSIILGFASVAAGLLVVGELGGIGQNGAGFGELGQGAASRPGFVADAWRPRCGRDGRGARPYTIFPFSAF